eukprot:CAMPEP_0173091760 /NCGR_PEP_ID=MMETSP1102-20130122/28339_1 /TAXON_ID=49646 /ORGANISM="Geminigera sp., Strain Caron Lab Isolate" /LENGTH=75 /DNA_ID=CAMNT_0013978151 /DNA_START=294 /DNA_END=521 /DNA_ORIENTATION=+
MREVGLQRAGVAESNVEASNCAPSAILLMRSSVSGVTANKESPKLKRTISPSSRSSTNPSEAMPQKQIPKTAHFA